MDRYTCRGKKGNGSGEWFYGKYDTVNGVHLICGENPGVCDYMSFDVYPETVGQCTGTRDKDGKPIFEGDIVKMHQFLFDGSEYENEITGMISYNAELMCFCLSKIDCSVVERHTGYEKHEGEIPISDFHGLHEESWEVIGNIHDNPELITSTPPAPQ